MVEHGQYLSSITGILYAYGTINAQSGRVRRVQKVLPPMSTRSFFSYYCDRCDRPFCERIHVMNLALNHIDEEYCLECLADDTAQSPEDFYTWILEYVQERECFLTPWTNFSVAACPRITDKTCFCPASSAGAAP